ncbi:LysE type translocator [Saccharothrix carnea]|uniref:LysE type translocator n=1 Tax=Saccharothrix carnea TaxID=1280637 RepID=A0A2P8I270_SACCR|nr:LysE family transporter [Saccharothrix carnea]PSL52569.1 LysE type translocator [Saccharothrix carnea]
MDALGLGLALGLAASISPGPLLVLVVTSALRSGWKSGALTACAPLLSDAAVVAVTLLLLDRLPARALGVLGVVGAVFVVWSGVQTVREARSASLTDHSSTPDPPSPKPTASPEPTSPEPASAPESASPKLAASPESDPSPEPAASPDTDAAPGAGTQPSAAALPGTDTRPSADARAGAGSPPGADTRPRTDTPPGADPRPRTDTRPGADASPGPDPLPAIHASQGSPPRGTLNSILPAGYDNSGSSKAAGALALRRAVLVNLLSPHPWIAWATALGPLTITTWRASAGAGAALLIGFYLTLVGGKVVIAVLVARGRRHLGDTGYRRALTVAGALLVLAGVAMGVEFAGYPHGG